MRGLHFRGDKDRNLDVKGKIVGLAFRESEAPYPSVRVFDDGDFDHRIQLADGRDNLLFALSQHKNGRIRIVHVEGDVAQLG